MKSTWRSVLKIVGLALAAAGMICMVVAYWSRLTALVGTCKQAVVKTCRGKCSEFDDYDDELLYE